VFYFLGAPTKNTDMQVYYDIAYPLANQQQADVEALNITYNGNSPIEELPKFTNLKHLDLILEKPLPKDDMLGKLTSLTKLIIRGDIQSLDFLGNLVCLQELDVQYYATTSNAQKKIDLPEKLGDLKELTQLRVSNLWIDALPTSIGKLQKLTHLHLTSCPNLTCLPEIVNELASLRFLLLLYSGIKTLNFTSHFLENLENLDISFTQINSLPENMTAYKGYLNFVNTPFYEQVGEATASQYNSFIPELREKVTDIEKKKAFFNLFCGFYDRIKAQNIMVYILEAMNFGHATLRNAAVSYWYRQNPSPFPPKEKMVLFLTPPKEFNWDWELITPLLEAQNIEISTKLDKTVTHIIVGSRLGAVLGKAQTLRIPIVSYGHLRDFMMTLDDTVYLNQVDESTQEMAENLLNLLRNEDETNVELGLQMALGGGLNDIYSYDIILYYIWNYIKNKTYKLAEQTLQKYLPIDVFLHLKALHQARNYYASETDIAKYLGNITSKSYLDIDKLAITFYQKFQAGSLFCVQNPQSFLWFCSTKRKNSVLKLNELQIPALPTTVGELKGIKILYLQNNALTSLPDEFANLTQLDTLNLDKNALTSFPEVLTRLPKLATLSLAHNQLKEIPVEIGKLKNLTTLNLYNNQLSTLPEEIYNLPALRRLEIGGKNPLARKRKQIQERMPYCMVITGKE
jgi:Leucine-rich repeat (LRR) protein